MDRQYGFIHEKLEIKILILFILRRLPKAVDMEKLTELTMCDGGFHFFDFADCVAELRSTGHIEETEDGWLITEKGRQNGEITESSLPYSVRMRAERNTAIAAQAQEREALISTSCQLRPRGGSTVHLSMSDGVGPVLSMELLAGSDAEAETMQKTFRTNAESIYLRIMNLLLEQEDRK